MIASRVAKADIDQEIGLISSFRKELGIDRAVIKAAHRPTIQAQHAGGQYQVGPCKVPFLNAVTRDSSALDSNISPAFGLAGNWLDRFS